jgi:hypothetical protein
MKHPLGVFAHVIFSVFGAGAAATRWFDLAGADIDRRAFVRRAHARAHGHRHERDNDHHGRHQDHRDHGRHRNHHDHRDHPEHQGGDTTLDFAS